VVLQFFFFENAKSKPWPFQKKKFLEKQPLQQKLELLENTLFSQKFRKFEIFLKIRCIEIPVTFVLGTRFE